MAAPQLIFTARKLSKYGVFSGPYLVQIQENTDQKKLRIWTLLTPCNSLSTFRRVYCKKKRKYSITKMRSFGCNLTPFKVEKRIHQIFTVSAAVSKVHFQICLSPCENNFFL